MTVGRATGDWFTELPSALVMTGICPSGGVLLVVGRGRDGNVGTGAGGICSAAPTSVSRFKLRPRIGLNAGKFTTGGATSAAGNWGNTTIVWTGVGGIVLAMTWVGSINAAGFQ